MAGFAPHWRWARGTARNGKRQDVPEKLTDHLVHWFENPFRVLNIKSREEGEAWYRMNTKVPDCMIPYLARYHWGDLHPKYPPYYSPPKKNKKKGKPVRKFEKHSWKFQVNFD